MTDTITPTPEEPRSGARCKGRGRGAFFVAGTLVVGALIGAFATKALSHGAGGWHGGWHHGGGHGFTRVHGPMGFLRGPADPKRMEKRAARMAKHLGVAVDATPEQSEKLVAIAKSLAADMAPLRTDLRATRRAAIDMLASDTVDRAALEKLRAEQIGRFDAASKRILDAVAEVSGVLTSEQRTQLRERIEHRREHRGSWGRHRGSGSAPDTADE